MAFSDLPGQDTSGATLWSRETTHHIKHSGTVNIGPRRHKRPVPRLDSMSRFFRGARKLKSARTARKRASKKQAREHSSRHLQALVVRAFIEPRPAPKSKLTWARFGRYLERSGAAPERSGFTRDEDSMVSVADTLERWQKNGDPYLVTATLSFPGKKEDLDLKEFVRNWTDRVGLDHHTRVELDQHTRVGLDHHTRLEWVAAIHTNTGNAHVHVAIRALAQDGRALSFSRSELREDFRAHAREVATDLIGYNTDQKNGREKAQARERGANRDRS
jgi:hypothetical protein